MCKLRQEASCHAHVMEASPHSVLQADWHLSVKDVTFPNPPAERLAPQGSLAVELDDTHNSERHLACLSQGLTDLQQKLNHHLTVWKDAVGNETTPSNDMAPHEDNDDDPSDDDA